MITAGSYALDRITAAKVKKATGHRLTEEVKTFLLFKKKKGLVLFFKFPETM